MDLNELQEVVSVCLDEIIQLKEENEKLRGQIQNMSQSIRSIVDCEKKIVATIDENANNEALNILLLTNTLENVKYEWNDPKADKEVCYYPQFYSIEETVESIVRDRKSLARFGDGEFAIMTNRERQKFQHLDDKLANRLKEVIASQEDDILIAIADNYGALDAYNTGGKQGIRLYMTDEIRREHRQFLDMDRMYHNAYVSRPYALFADNNTDAPGDRFANLKRIWDNRKIVFIEGALTRLGVGNNLFDNAADIRRIEAPPTNSFDKYDEILSAALACAEPDTLFLIAMGPSAGVLAYDITHAGYQAVDIGHVDLEYEWFLRGTGGRCEVKNKYNNEYIGGDLVEDICDEKYLKEIIYVVGE